MSYKKKDPIFDVTLFKRLLQYIKPYKAVFFGILFAVVIISLASAVRPYVLQQAIDNNIVKREFEGFLPYVYVMVGLLMVEAIFQLLFILNPWCSCLWPHTPRTHCAAQ